MELDVFKTAYEWGKEGKSFVIAEVVEARGSVPRKAGARMLYSADGVQVGSIGGGEAEADVIERAKRLLSQGGRAQLVEYDLDAPEGPTCGGRIKVFIEPVVPQRRLLIFGAGHVGAALAQLMLSLGWTVLVYDYREDRLSLPEFDKCTKIHARFEDAADNTPFANDLHIVVMTPEHRFDFDAVKGCIGKPWASLGVLGSKHKRKQLLEILHQIEAPDEFVSNIRIPVGVPIKSETPMEIAVSIAAELIDLEFKRRRGI